MKLARAAQIHPVIAVGGPNSAFMHEFLALIDYVYVGSMQAMTRWPTPFAAALVEEAAAENRGDSGLGSSSASEAPTPLHVP